jgi:hypothetical protein
VSHVSLDEMASGKGAAETQFTSKHGSSHNASESPRVVTRIGWVRAPNTQEIQHSALRLQNGPASNRTDFNGWHGDTDLEVIVVAGRLSKKYNEWGD